MRFAEVIGSGGIVEALRNMADTGRIPHAMMLYENDGCGALGIVQAFLQYLACENRHDGDSCGECRGCRQVSKAIYTGIHYSFPITTGTKVSGAAKDLTCDMFGPLWKDLLVRNPYFTEQELSSALGFEKKQGQILVAEGKSILKALSLSTATGGYRAMVIYLPEKLNAPTANMLLKSIEEPAEGTMFLMVTHSPSEVLQTISSRCQAIRVLPLSRQEVEAALVGRLGVDAQDAAMAASLSGGSIGMALRHLSEQEETATMRDLLDDMMQALFSKDLYALLEVSEGIVALDSREKQKAFCAEAGELCRQIFMARQGLGEIAPVYPSMQPVVDEAASRLPATFPRRAMEIFSRAQGLLDRNVNPKTIFTNLVDRLYVNV